MTKRFTLHIKWYNYEKTDGEAELKDNGQPLLISEDVEDMRCVKDLLNELNDENCGIKRSFGEKPSYWYRKYRRVSDENEELKKQINGLIRGMQDSARMSADAICKPMMKEQWGDIDGE